MESNVVHGGSDLKLATFYKETEHGDPEMYTAQRVFLISVFEDIFLQVDKGARLSTTIRVFLKDGLPMERAAQLFWLIHLEKEKCREFITELRLLHVANEKKEAALKRIIEWQRSQPQREQEENIRNAKEQADFAVNYILGNLRDELLERLLKKIFGIS
jgi:hypothetical protein